MTIKSYNAPLALSLFRQIVMSSFLATVLSGCGAAGSFLELPQVNISRGSGGDLALCANNAVTTASCKIEGSGKVVSDNFGSSITSWSNPAQATTIVATVPNGFYANQNVNFTESNLVAANIVNGVSIFGVTGTATAAGPYAACAAGLNSSQCSTSANQYVTGTAGANVAGSNGALSATISAGYYSGSQTATMSDTNLTAANIKTGTTIFGITGSLVSAYAACTDDSLNASACSTTTNRYVYTTANGGRSSNCVAGINSAACWTNAANQYVTGTAGSNISGSNGSLSATISSGYYSGSQTATMSDTNLTAANIKTGTTIFGVTGSLTGAYAACTDGSLNTSACSTATNRYVYTTANGGRSSNCVAGINAAACWSNAANQYVTGTAGSNVTGTDGSLSATIPQGYYSGTETATMSDTNLVAANIKSGATIFGVSGNYTGTAGTGTFAEYVPSNMHRDIATTQITHDAEATANAATAYSNANPGYRAVPDINKDDEGADATSPVVKVNRTSGATGAWAARTCGTNSGDSIETRIASCATQFGVDATWDGAVKGNAGQGMWKLVTRTANLTSNKGREVWRDERTKLMWSSLVATSTNWCKASGSNFITGNPATQNDPSDICDNATSQNTGTGPGTKAISACFEDGGNYFSSTDAAIDNAGKAGLGWSSSPRVAWRLPTKYDYQLADNNGIRFVLPEMLVVNNLEWTATIWSSPRNNAWTFRVGTYANVAGSGRANSNAVRCVGR